MELKNIDTILEKYFRGETDISEENELRKYFSSSNVAPHLEQYKPLFSYITASKGETFDVKMPLHPTVRERTRSLAWMSIAATIAVLVGVATYTYYSDEMVNPDLGTYDNPEVALVETQKALDLLSMQVNSGIESVMYVKEYKKTKNVIFK